MIPTMHHTPFQLTISGAAWILAILACAAFWTWIGITLWGMF